MQPSKLDRYMQRKGKGKLQGFALHDYRANFKPTKDSYDFDNKSVHSRRLLLKAEPQSGKTGITQLQHACKHCIALYQGDKHVL